MLEFIKWPKIPRLENEEWTITEKIDGTNSCVIITDTGEIGAQSRQRLITPENDNFGFAQFVQDHKEELLKMGAGHHYGEWWGKGIQRGYGLDEKRFSLFEPWKALVVPKCVRVVPQFGDGYTVEDALYFLKKDGSLATPWDKPEGLVVVSKHYRAAYKVIIEE